MKKEKEKKNKVYIIIIIILLLLLLGAFIFILTSRNTSPDKLSADSGADDYDGNHQSLQLSDGTPGIAIAGMPDSLAFIAGQTKQKINIYNPSANNCLMLPSVYVDDKLIWQGGYLAPGKAYYEIDLDYPLKSGEYSGYVFYECYKEDGTQLNNAKVKFNLIVKE